MCAFCDFINQTRKQQIQSIEKDDTKTKIHSFRCIKVESISSQILDDKGGVHKFGVYGQVVCPIQHWISLAYCPVCGKEICDKNYIQ